MCQYCEFKNERGAKAFIREDKTRIFIKPMDKLNMGTVFIAVETENFKRYENINFCPFCGKKLHKGYINGVEEKIEADGTKLQIQKYRAEE